jgi:hypothetical protein
VTFTDAESAVVAWVAAVPGLTGQAGAIPSGLHHTHRHGGTGNGAYGLVSRLPGGEHPAGAHDQAIVSVTFFAPTKEACSRAAVAYCNALTAIGKHPQPDPAATAAGTLVGAGNINGPSYLPEGSRPRYVVDAEFTVAPA